MLDFSNLTTKKPVDALIGVNFLLFIMMNYIF